MGQHSSPKRRAQSAQPSKGKGRRNLWTAVAVICIVIAVGALVHLGLDLNKYRVADQDFQKIAQEFEQDAGEISDGDAQAAKLAKLHKKNPDCAGWIKIPDTRINYPVMFTPDDPEHYLHLNFEGQYSFAGTPFFGEGCKPKKGNSTIVYAHHLLDGSMFSNLHEFDDKDYALAHEINLTTLNGTTTYIPYAAMYEDLTVENHWHYWDNVGKLNKKKFKKFLRNVYKRTLYTTDYTPKFGDKLLMCSTCSYGTQEERFVVFAVCKAEDTAEYAETEASTENAQDDASTQGSEDDASTQSTDSEEVDEG